MSDSRNNVSRADAEAAVRTLLRWSGEDPAREGLIDTPKRVVKAYEDWFSGYALDPDEYLARTFEEVEGYDELIVLRDLLSARQQIVLMERIDVLEVVLGLRAWQELHAAVFEVSGCQCHPGGHNRIFIQTPIECVLVPGHEPGTVGFFDEEIRRPAQEVRAEHVFRRIDDFRMVHKLINPPE